MLRLYLFINGGLFLALSLKVPAKKLYISSFFTNFYKCIFVYFLVFLYIRTQGNSMINNKMVYECPLITVTELADMLHLSKSYLYHDIYKAKHNHTVPLLPYIKLGGRIFYRSNDVKDMIDKEFSKPINFY